ncbi:MAG: hypothetical protein JWN96_4619, partial [Mycobacterium sp.]|nr:hypothetical protein [Mycobacterium sp.]
MFRVKKIRCEDTFSFSRYSANVSTSLETGFDTGPAVTAGLCSEPAGLDDLSLLTHQAAQGMRSVLDRL